MREIKDRWSGAVIFRDEEAETLGDAVIRFIANHRQAGTRADLTRANLTDANLTDANLTDANLTDANLTDADLTDANLTDAVLTDADLTDANLTDADLTRANLTDADLTDANLTDANLTDANLTDANLTRADLTDADLTDANLTDADLTDANLTDAESPDYERIRDEFRARNPDVPIVENLDKRICDIVDSGQGQLKMSTWHFCETTHCRAGWAIHLAGEAGYELEKKYGPARAGGWIYRASTGRWPYFYASDADALADICEWGAKDAAAQMLVSEDL